MAPQSSNTTSENPSPRLKPVALFGLLVLALLGFQPVLDRLGENDRRLANSEDPAIVSERNRRQVQWIKGLEKESGLSDSVSGRAPTAEESRIFEPATPRSWNLVPDQDDPRGQVLVDQHGVRRGSLRRQSSGTAQFR